jgi:hypothetical protein
MQMAQQGVMRQLGQMGIDPSKGIVANLTVFPVFPAIVEDHIFTGLTANVSEKFAVNVAYELAFNNSQMSGVSLLANEYTGSTSELLEHLVLLSVTLGL